MNKTQIEREFKAGDMDYLQAIEALQDLAYSGREAESIVEEWQEEKNKK